ncbi:lysozyme inhibitor LprI family protein [Sutterella sp.]|uniref:lysozyme inhibitor LprI family protein n=1 Tax=Sutterella sp. TaxID=1981025 RepID=UPI003FD8BCF0
MKRALVAAFAAVLTFSAGAAWAAAQTESPTSEAVTACYAKAKGDDAEAKGRCLEMELEMTQAQYKNVTDRVASLAKALDKESGRRTLWNKFILAGQSFETFVKRECDFVGDATKGARRIEQNAELSCRIGYYRIRTNILMNRHLSQQRY